MSDIATMIRIARKEVQKEMNKFVMDGFNRDNMLFCCDNATVTMDTDLGEVTTGVKDLKFFPSNMGTSTKGKLEDYVRKDELEDLISKISDGYDCVVSHDDAADAFKLLHERLSKGNKEKNEISFLNYEKEIKGYELLQAASHPTVIAKEHLKN